MQRLEVGMVRRGRNPVRKAMAITAPPAEAPPAVEPQASVDPDRLDDRLRSAIHELQKFAARGG
jgi:hypothetical protein